MAAPNRAYKFTAAINEWYERNASPTGGGLEWMVQVVIDTLGEIVDRTPVKSGRAKNNWKVGVGVPPRGTTRQGDRTGLQAIRQGALQMMRLRRVEPAWIVNNLPYALRLERGYSSQAPYGMVAMAIEAIGNRYGVSGAGLGQYVQSGRYRGASAPAASGRAA